MTKDGTLARLAMPFSHLQYFPSQLQSWIPNCIQVTSWIMKVEQNGSHKGNIMKIEPSNRMNHEATRIKVISHHFVSRSSTSGCFENSTKVFKLPTIQHYKPNTGRVNATTFLCPWKANHQQLISCSMFVWTISSGIFDSTWLLTLTSPDQLHKLPSQ